MDRAGKSGDGTLVRSCACHRIISWNKTQDKLCKVILIHDQMRFTCFCRNQALLAASSETGEVLFTCSTQDFSRSASTVTHYAEKSVGVGGKRKGYYYKERQGCRSEGIFSRQHKWTGTKMNYISQSSEVNLKSSLSVCNCALSLWYGYTIGQTQSSINGQASTGSRFQTPMCYGSNQPSLLDRRKVLH